MRSADALSSESSRSNPAFPQDARSSSPRRFPAENLSCRREQPTEPLPVANAGGGSPRPLLHRAQLDAVRKVPTRSLKRSKGCPPPFEQKHRRTVLRRPGPQTLQENGNVRGGDPAERLVEQQQAGAHRRGGCQGGLLRLPSGESRGVMFLEMRYPEQLQRVVDAVADLAEGEGQVLRPEGDLLVEREGAPREGELRILLNELHVRRPSEARPGGDRFAGKLRAARKLSASVLGNPAAEHRRQRGLSGAVPPFEQHPFAREEAQRGDRHDRGVRAGRDEACVVEREEGKPSGSIRSRRRTSGFGDRCEIRRSGGAAALRIFCNFRRFAERIASARSAERFLRVAGPERFTVPAAGYRPRSARDARLPAAEEARPPPEQPERLHVERGAPGGKVVHSPSTSGKSSAVSEEARSRNEPCTGTPRASCAS